MESLKKKFAEKALPAAAELKTLVKEKGETIIANVTLDQVVGGMKGIPGLVTETSKLDAEEGIRFRGYSIPELREQLPKVPGGFEPLPEGIFYLMLVGELPNYEEVSALTSELHRRSDIPDYVFRTLDQLPPDCHPMTQFSIGVLAMRPTSLFKKGYDEGLNKKDYWSVTYEDALNLIARLPRLAAYIYRKTYYNNHQIAPDPTLDWAANYAHMMGYDSLDFRRLMRLYLTIHADHEGGNVSAHACHLVGSALGDAYLSFSAAMNGLAGPLHGLANQEVIKWIQEMRTDLGGGKPTREQIVDYVKKTLSEGKVIPGYGHAVLRKTDPRFTAQMEFANRYIKDNDIVDIVHMIYEVVPPVLSTIGKIKNPWPNVDAHSGALLLHYGMKEYDYFTVLFGVSRALGVMAQLIWDRALGLPIERPNSTTIELLKQKVAEVK